jgi:hypothetical protein
MTSRNIPYHPAFFPPRWFFSFPWEPGRDGDLGRGLSRPLSDYAVPYLRLHAFFIRLFSMGVLFLINMLSYRISVMT